MAFSANKSTEAAVAVALAEDGVPWFKDLREIISTDDSSAIDTFAIIRKKAQLAADKGASALIIYNKTGARDLEYNRYDSAKAVSIPVVYIKGAAFDKYASDESSILDIKLNVDLQPKSRVGNNVIGYADRGAKTTVVTTANLDDYTSIAALMEVARLVKASKTRSHNYLFIAYCGEKGGSHGTSYFSQHRTVDQPGNSINLDSLSATVDNPKGLNLVKRSIEIINNN